MIAEESSSSEKWNEYKDSGLTGLANLGNTCFINSAIQCLSHTYEFSKFLDKDYKKKLNKIPDTLIFIEWDKLRKLMWSENCIIQPNGFLSSVHKVARIKDIEIFTGYAQNDLTEFLQFCIDCFHNSIKREVEMKINGSIKNGTDKIASECYRMMKNMYKKEYSEIINMFYGIHVSKIKSLESDYLNLTPEPFFNIMLPISRNKTLEGSFELYATTEKMTGENKIFNEETNKKEDAEKTLLFWSLPNILIVTLKRFSANLRKNQDLVDFPLENLDLRKYVIGYDKKSYVYDLYGICNHSGNVMGGHYTSFVKNANGKWYHFNDTSVSQVKTLSSLKSNKAYCFFYRKKSM